MKTRALVFGWIAALLVMALVLERVPLPIGRDLGHVLQSERFHVFAHTVLYGTLAVLLAQVWFPSRALDDRRSTLRWRAVGAAAMFLFAACAQELVQVVSRGRWPNQEEGFDLAVDIAGASLGVIAWSLADGRRKYPVARTLGVVLHPAFVGPLGMFAVLWSALEDATRAAWWTAVACVAVMPVVVVWQLGLRRGWFSDRDLSVRRERPVFLLVSLATALGLYFVTRGSVAPVAVQQVALAGLVATVLVAGVTVAGVKVSGHVAVPVGVGVLMQATSVRGYWPFVLAALALSWARVREGRHAPHEVLGAWAIAGASGGVSRVLGGA